MKQLDPYVEIEKVPLFAADNMQSRGYSVRIENPKKPSGWQEVGLVSADYLLVPNRQVRDMALEITSRTSMQWQEAKVFFDGKRFLYGLVAQPERTAVEVRVGDVLSLGLLFENSYDGSRRLAASLFAYRLACINGMLMPQYFARMRFKHDNTAIGWDEEVAQALSIIEFADEALERFANAARRLAQIPLGSTELKVLRRDVLARLPVTLWGKVMDRYLLQEELTGWGLLNAGTNIVWHNEKSTIQDFNYNEYITTSLIQWATEQRADLLVTVHGGAAADEAAWGEPAAGAGAAAVRAAAA